MPYHAAPAGCQHRLNREYTSTNWREKMSGKKIKVGMVGLGQISYAHEAGYTEIPELVEIAAVCDLDEAKAHYRAERYQAKVYTDYQQLLADSQIDVVDIALPHHLHYPAAMATLEAGKHLLLEKPLAMTSQLSLEICQKAHAAGLKFTVAENTRFVKAYIAAERMLKENALGEILLVRTFLPANERHRLSSPDFWGKKSAFGGGTIFDSGPHTFFLLKWLFGGVLDLQAFASQIYDFESEVDDNAEVRGHLANGAEFICGFSFTTEIPHNERLEIYGRKGSLIIDQLVDPPAKFYEGPHDFDGTPLPDVPYQPSGWQYFSIVAEVIDFVQAVYEDRPPLIDPQDGVYAIQVVEKAYESVASQNKRITFP